MALIVLRLVALLIPLLVASIGANAQTPAANWVLLGKASLPVGNFRATLDLDDNDKRTSAVRIVVKPVALVPRQATITYANGQTHFEPLDEKLPDGRQFGEVDARAEELRIVARVVVEFAPDPPRGQPVEIEVWGRLEPMAPALQARAADKVSAASVGDPKRAAGADKQRSQMRGAPPPAAPVVATPSGPAPSSRPEDRWIAVPVFYGTTRHQETDRQKSAVKLAAFGAQFDPKMTLGKAVVTIPIEREPGSIPRPPGLIFEFRKEDPMRDFTLARVDVLSQSAFEADLKASASGASRYRNQALVFIHGYNVSFDDALFRTAQITHDIGFDGPAILYSWPSRGSILSYAYDFEAATLLARDGLRQLLELVAADTAVIKINVIAHSLGNAPLLDVLREEANTARVAPTAARLKLNEIVLASPDVSVSYFLQFAGAATALVRHGMTLYASSNDRALQVSSNVRLGMVRAGDVPKDGPVVVPGVDSIDVSAADTSWFSVNHSTFADRGDIVSDMRLLFEKGVHPPSARGGFYRQRGPAALPWWQYFKP